MKEWHRIFDDEIARFGNAIWTLRIAVGEYRIKVNQANQDNIQVNYQDTTEHWPVNLKEQRGSEFKLSGMAWETPEILLNTFTWFELHVSSDAQIT